MCNGTSRTDQVPPWNRFREGDPADTCWSKPSFTSSRWPSGVKDWKSTSMACYNVCNAALEWNLPHLPKKRHQTAQILQTAITLANYLITQNVHGPPQLSKCLWILPAFQPMAFNTCASKVTPGQVWLELDHLFKQGRARVTLPHPMMTLTLFWSEEYVQWNFQDRSGASLKQYPNVKAGEQLQWKRWNRDARVKHEFLNLVILQGQNKAKCDKLVRTEKWGSKLPPSTIQSPPEATTFIPVT